MSRRGQVLLAIPYAGYHEDTAAGVRLYINNRVSLAAYTEAFNKGRAAKEMGVPCGCVECRKTGEAS